MDTKLMRQIKDILKEFPQYWSGEELQRPVVIDDLKKYDILLLSALLKNQRIRENYSVKAGDVVIFKVLEFIDILRYKDYWTNSYTKYSNTIGLSSDGKYLQYNTDVVLDFPYKDCILEGGMTKEDVGKEEVFYNEVIARDEIDILLAPKILVNIKKYDAEGEYEINSFDNEDNLIIKGNNLLALHSLKERYLGKVKCIYIDPPYNTKNDSFVYNDRYNHSSWLSFMKNRLEIAYDLLSDDGVIFIQSDDNEQSYLKILVSEIFGLSNFVATIPVISNLKGNQDQYGFAGTHEYLTVFAKNTVIAKFNNLLIRDESIDEWEKDEFGYFKKGANLKATGVNAPRIKRPNLYYPIYIDEDKKINFERQSENDFELFPITDGQEMSWRWQKETMERLIDDVIVIKGVNDYSLYKKQRPELGELPSKKPKSIFYRPEYSSGNGTNQIKALFGEKIFSFPKPEHLISDIIQIGSKENDIVLDFFMGSAATQAVAMKMNRRFIGIEQMDYINTVSVPRLKKVIEGEQGGISKDVNWQGGGSFVYAELMELNQLYMNKIDQSSTEGELAELWDELNNNADLNFQLDKEKLTNELLKEHGEVDGSITFKDLTFEEQKKIFKKALDKNQLYVPYSEIDDANVIISNSDKAFNHSFYSSKGDSYGKGAVI